MSAALELGARGGSGRRWLAARTGDEADEQLRPDPIHGGRAGEGEVRDDDHGVRRSSWSRAELRSLAAMVLAECCERRET